MRAVGSVVLIVMQVAGTFGVGCWLLLMPVRASQVLHEAFVIFPHVAPRDTIKKLCVRLLGGVCLLLAADAALGLARVVKAAGQALGG